MRKIVPSVESKSMIFAAWLIVPAALTGCGSGVRTGSGVSLPTSTLVVSAAPKLGYAWNATDKTLRPIVGIPGAAQFGESVTPAGAYEFGLADPTGSVAVLVGDAQSVYTMTLPGGRPMLVAGKAVAASKVVFSPRGMWAFLFSPGNTSGSLLTQLSGNPQLKAVTLPSPVTDAAVSDTGSIATALRSAEDVRVQVTAVSGMSIPLTSVKTLGGMSFVAGADDLLLADAANDSLLRIRSASTSPAISTVPTAGLLKKPVSLAASRAARWVVIANGGEPSAVRIDLGGLTPAQKSSCGCQPSVVSQLTGEGAFQLTALQDGPVWIGDASKSTFPVLFVPAIPGHAK